MIEALTSYYNFNTKCNFKQNEKKEGIEVYFTSVPTKEEREKLKESNWHWNHKKSCWYVKEKLLKDMNILSDKVEKKTKKKEKVETIEKKELSKTVLSRIKNILNNKSSMEALKGYTPIKHYTSTKSYDYRVAFTDSYRLCILNKEYLPFKVCFSKDSDIREDYLKKYEDKIEGEIEHNYPIVEKLIPQTNPKDTFTFNAKEIKDNAKENKGFKNRDKRVMTFKTNNEEKELSMDSQFLSDMIALLEIKDEEITMNYYGEFKPLTYENENGYYLALPIKTY